MRRRPVVPVPLWGSVRKEIQWFISVLPLLFAQLDQKWDSELVCPDAAPSGFGVVARQPQDLPGRSPRPAQPRTGTTPSPGGRRPCSSTWTWGRSR